MIRTSFPGHIPQCGSSITIPVLLSQVLCIFIIYTRSGEIGKSCQSLRCRNKGGISAKCCHCLCLAVTAQELHQLASAQGALFWLQGEFHCPHSAHTSAPGAPSWRCPALAEAQQSSLHARAWCVANPVSEHTTTSLCPLQGDARVERTCLRKGWWVLL